MNSSNICTNRTFARVTDQNQDQTRTKDSYSIEEFPVPLTQCHLVVTRDWEGVQGERQWQDHSLLFPFVQFSFLRLDEMIRSFPNRKQFRMMIRYLEQGSKDCHHVFRFWSSRFWSADPWPWRHLERNIVLILALKTIKRLLRPVKKLQKGFLISYDSYYMTPIIWLI